jgi:acyl-CoA thioester hydrolase
MLPTYLQKQFAQLRFLVLQHGFKLSFASPKMLITSERAMGRASDRQPLPRVHALQICFFLSPRIPRLYAARMAELFRYTHRVTYAECTVGDHIYHSRYLDVLEAARGEFMRSLGRTVLECQNDDCIFPVIEARLRYKFPARYDDLLTVEVWVTRVEGVRLNFGHRVSNQAGKLILEAETFHCCTGRDEKPKRLPVEMLEKLKRYLSL